MSNPEKKFNTFHTRHEKEVSVKVLDLYESIINADTLAKRYNQMAKQYDFYMENFLDITFKPDQNEIFKLTSKDPNNKTPAVVNDRSREIYEINQYFNNQNPAFIDEITITLGSDDIQTYSVIELTAKLDNIGKELSIIISTQSFLEDYNLEIYNYED
jgi:hypothetical protein